MRSSYIPIAATALLSTTIVNAYQNTSPFIYHSTSSSSSEDSSIPQLLSASEVENLAIRHLQQCSTSHIIFAHQPNVLPLDYEDATLFSSLHLRLNNRRSNGLTLSVRDVTAEIDESTLQKAVINNCGTYPITTINAAAPWVPEPTIGNENSITRVRLMAPVGDVAERRKILERNDLFLSTLIDTHFNDEDYTLVYMTTPVADSYSTIEEDGSSRKQYEMDEDAYHVLPHQGDLKRDLYALKSNSSKGHGNSSQPGNATLVDGPLFEKYQFLSPGIFSGLLVGIILLGLMYVGISALNSLEVSYGAFDKEAGQLASTGKKQQ